MSEPSITILCAGFTLCSFLYIFSFCLILLSACSMIIPSWCMYKPTEHISSRDIVRGRPGVLLCPGELFFRGRDNVRTRGRDMQEIRWLTGALWRCWVRVKKRWSSRRIVYRRDERSANRWTAAAATGRRPVWLRPPPSVARWPSSCSSPASAPSAIVICRRSGITREKTDDLPGQ